MRRISRTWRSVLAVSALCFSLVALIGPVQRATAATTFRQVTVEAGRNGDCKGIVDIDGDGVGDPFIAALTLTWYHSPGGDLGGQWVKRDIATATNDFSEQCSAVDVNRDGAPDVVVPDTTSSGGDLLWFENPRGHGGNPATDKWVRHVIGSPTYFFHDLATVDLNGDGKVDVVTRSYTNTFDLVDIWTQGANGTWSRQQMTNGPAGQGLAVGDVDMDGKPDIVTGGYWRRNPGWELRPITGDGGGSPVVADFDGDGRNDVALASMEYQSSDVSYFTSSTPLAGPWVKHTVDPTVRTQGHAMTTADFNGDGRADLLLGYMAQPYVTPWAIYVYLNPAASGAWQRIELTAGGGHNMVAGDLNGDGRPDVFGSMYGGDPATDYPSAAQVPGTPGAFAWRNDTGGAPATSTTTTSTTVPTTTTTRATTTTTASTTTASTTTTSKPTTTTTAPTTTTTTTGSPVRYEAELANYPAGVDGNDRTWCPCSNNRAVGDFREPGEYVTWNVNVPTTRSYTLTWRYGAGDAAAPRQLSVNGTVINTNLSFAKTSTWSAWATRSVAVNLKAGANSVTLTAGNTWVYLNVDYMDVG